MLDTMRQLRKKKGLTMKELGERVGVAGVLPVFALLPTDSLLDYKNSREKVDFAFFEVGEYTYIAKIKMAHSAFWRVLGHIPKNKKRPSPVCPERVLSLWLMVCFSNWDS